MTEGIPAAWFVAYAGSDVGRWQELLGAVVAPTDAKWGMGRVRDVRWEARRGETRPLGTVYARVEYKDGFAAQVNASSFADLHATVWIGKPLAALLRDTFDPASCLSEREREERLARHDGERIARRDAERTRRSNTVRRNGSRLDRG